jgi:hypothetical protein
MITSQTIQHCSYAVQSSKLLQLPSAGPTPTARSSSKMCSVRGWGWCGAGKKMTFNCLHQLTEQYGLDILARAPAGRAPLALADQWSPWWWSKKSHLASILSALWGIYDGDVVCYETLLYITCDDSICMFV